MSCQLLVSIFSRLFILNVCVIYETCTEAHINTARCCGISEMYHSVKMLLQNGLNCWEFFFSALYGGFIVDALESRGRKSLISPKFFVCFCDDRLTLSSNPSELLPKIIDYGSENKVV